jgi:hypothetical protein
MPIRMLAVQQLLDISAIWLLCLNETEDLCSHMNVVATLVLQVLN